MEIVNIDKKWFKFYSTITQINYDNPDFSHDFT